MSTKEVFFRIVCARKTSFANETMGKKDHTILSYMFYIYIYINIYFILFFKMARKLAKNLFCYTFSVTNIDIESCKYCKFLE